MLKAILGLITGLINGLLGAGGGMIAVPFLKKFVSPQEAHATSVAIIFPICILSAIRYIESGFVNITDAVPYFIFGLPGAIAGTYCLTKFSASALRIIFSVFVIWAGIRMLL